MAKGDDTERMSAIESAPTEALPADDSLPGGMLPPGARVDHYEVIRLLGAGGMGEVYLAADRQLDRHVALKLVRPELLGTDKARSSFMFEARTTARFNHPHIVTVYGVGQIDDTPYVALEYVDGTTLDQLPRPMPAQDAAQIMLAVAEALVEAHKHGVLHRDLKPGNVLIPREGRPRVADFGLAKPIGEAADGVTGAAPARRDFTWAGAGTPSYMAPEQFLMLDVTKAADIWAFGVMLFELCEGRRPFDGHTLDALRHAVCVSDPPELSADHPAPLRELVACCLLADPALRPSAEDVRRELRALLGLGLDSSAGHLLSVPAPRITQSPAGAASSQGERTRVPRRRRWALWLIPLALAAAALWWGIGVDRAPPPQADGSVQTPADEAFAAAVDQWRRGSRSRTPFHAVLDLDPAHAPTHIFLAFRDAHYDRERARQHLRRAQEARPRLSDRDRGLVDALSALLHQDPPDIAEHIAALARLAEQFPRDVFVSYVHASAVGLSSAGRFDVAAGAYRRTLSIDPDYVPAVARLGEMLAYAGQLDDAERWLDDCVARHPDADDCLLFRSLLDEGAGRCDRVARWSRERIARFPDHPDAYGSLGRALAGMERIDAAAQALQQRWARLDDTARPFVEALDQIDLSILRGALGEAERGARALLVRIESSHDEWRHAQVVDRLIAILDETDRAADAADTARDFSARREALSRDAVRDEFSLIKDLTPKLIAARRDAGELDDARAQAELGAWRDAVVAAAPPLAGHVWLHGIAATVRSAPQARWALAQQPPLPPFAPWLPIATPRGNALFHAGDHAAAVAVLEAAVRDCRVLDHGIDHMRALEQLGRAYQETGNAAGACQAYRRFTALWPDPDPPARSARRVRAAIARLACP